MKKNGHTILLKQKKHTLTVPKGKMHIPTILPIFILLQKNYNKAIQLLLSVEYNDVFYQLGSKTILLKSYYELDEYDAMTSLMDSFRILLQRKKDISKNNKQLYLNFIIILKKLIAKTADKTKMKTLQEKIAKTSPLADRKWLNEKVNELL